MVWHPAKEFAALGDGFVELSHQDERVGQLLASRVIAGQELERQTELRCGSRGLARLQQDAVVVVQPTIARSSSERPAVRRGGLLAAGLDVAPQRTHLLVVGQLVRERSLAQRCEHQLSDSAPINWGEREQLLGLLLG